MTEMRCRIGYDYGNKASGPGAALTAPDPVNNLVGGVDVSDTTCCIDGCEKPVLVKFRQLCRKHYERFRRHGDPLVLEPRRSSTSNVDVHGYRRVKCPGHPMAIDRGWALEHRMVAWDSFGPFDPGMIVHHKNQDKLDNRPDNLELLWPEEHGREHFRRRIDHDEAVRLYLSGLSTIKVAAALGTNPGWISRILKSQGVPARKSGVR